MCVCLCVVIFVWTLCVSREECSVLCVWTFMFPVVV